MIHLKRLFESATQSSVLRDMSARLQERVRTLTIEGPIGGAKGLTIAQAALAEQRPLAVLTGTTNEARNLEQEIKATVGENKFFAVAAQLVSDLYDFSEGPYLLNRHDEGGG